MKQKKTEKNLLSNVNLLGLAKAQEVLLSQALKRVNLEEMKNFEQKYSQVVNDYLTDPKLSFSNIFDVNDINSYKAWIGEFLDRTQKEKYILLVIAKMMKQDPLAYSIYKSIYENTSPELILTYDKVMQDSKLKEVYMNIGASVGDAAQLQAGYWLMSDEARTILCAYEYYDAEVDLLLPNGCTNV